MHKELLKLAGPNILTNLTVPLVGMVDLGLMGRMPSSSYIIAIGFGTVIFNFLYWAFGFLRMGTTGLVAQAFGKNDSEQIKDFLKKGLLIGLLSGITIILFKSLLLKCALLLINPDQTVLAALIQYFEIRVYAAPATITLYALMGWLLGMQDSRSALIVAVLVNVINVLVSYLLVVQLDWGIEGVALGTVVAQYLGLLFTFLVLQFKYKHNIFKVLFSVSNETSLGWRHFLKVNGDILIRTLSLIFVMSFFKTKAGNVDPILGAANILLFEFITLSAYGIDGIAFASESISGKYFGQRNRIDFHRSVIVSMGWGIGLATLIAFLFYAFGENILGLLTDKTEVIDSALEFLPWLIAAPIINAFAFVWDGIYIGTTASVAMRNTMLLSAFLIFLPIFYWAETTFGNHGIWLAFSIFMLSRGLLQTFLAPKVIYAKL